jgi:hypothetical protein
LTITISDAEMEARLALVRPYVMVLLKAGPAYVPPDTRSPDQAAIVKEHGRRNMALRKEGKMAMVGPVHQARPVVGICIMNVDADATRRIMDADPAVRAGIFLYDLATWFGVPGDGLPPQ